METGSVPTRTNPIEMASGEMSVPFLHNYSMWGWQKTAVV